MRGNPHRIFCQPSRIPVQALSGFHFYKDSFIICDCFAQNPSIMVRTIFKWGLIITLSMSCRQKETPNTGMVENGERDSLETLADTYLRKLTSLDQFNGAILLKKDGEVLLEKAYNMTSDSSSTLYVTRESQFDLRSVAKLFARVAVLQLEKEGKLSREDSIGTYLSGFPNGAKITIQHLLDHTSGLPREFNDSIGNTLSLSPDEVIALASREPLEFEPGSREQYSNVGFQLLYYIIGKVSGGSFSDYLKKNVFSPLGMKASGGNFDSDLSHLTKYAYGHYWDQDKNLRTEKTFPPDDMKMGNLHATVEDLDRFLTSLDPEVYESLSDKGSISHAGGTRGKRAYVERNYKEDYSIVFLANYDGIPFERMVSDLQKLLTGQPVSMPERVQRQPVEIAPEILQQYEGTYDFVEAGHLLLTIRLEQDSLWVYQKGQNNGVLYPESESVFFGDPTSRESLEFVPDGSGGFHALLDFQGVQWKGVKVPSKEED